MGQVLEPDYLGDGVYVTDMGYQLMLTANHHDPAQATDTIYLDQHVLDALNRYNERGLTMSTIKRMHGVVNIPKELGGGILNWDDCDNSVFTPMSTGKFQGMRPADILIRDYTYVRWFRDNADKPHRNGLGDRRAFRGIAHLLAAIERAQAIPMYEAPRHPPAPEVDPRTAIVHKYTGQAEAMRTIDIMYKHLHPEEYKEWCKGVLGSTGPMVTATTDPAEIVQGSFLWGCDGVDWYGVQTRLRYNKQEGEDDASNEGGIDWEGCRTSKKVHIESTPSGEDDFFKREWLRANQDVTIDLGRHDTTHFTVARNAGKSTWQQHIADAWSQSLASDLRDRITSGVTKGMITPGKFEALYHNQCNHTEGVDKLKEQVDHIKAQAEEAERDRILVEDNKRQGEISKLIMDKSALQAKRKQWAELVGNLKVEKHKITNTWFMWGKKKELNRVYRDLGDARDTLLRLDREIIGVSNRIFILTNGDKPRKGVDGLEESLRATRNFWPPVDTSPQVTMDNDVNSLYQEEMYPLSGPNVSSLDVLEESLRATRNLWPGSKPYDTPAKLFVSKRAGSPQYQLDAWLADVPKVTV